MKEGDRGFCFVRSNRDGRMVLETYGRSTGFCIDPIEKKPLNHFLPGTPVLSFGTAGCNLGCKFCQNWDISKSREVSKLSEQAGPEAIAAAAERSGCRSVAFTYNDPVIWAEYAIDTAAACHARNIKTVAVTAGYITEQARGEFFDSMDAANIDLKAFTEDFYFKLTSSHLANVLDTIRYAVNETDCWVELTNLIIPQANDSEDEIRRLCDWILDEIGDQVPIHFTAFHPDFRMQDRPGTPPETLWMAYDVARNAGIRFTYVGNIHDTTRQSTYCHSCKNLLIERDWHQLGRYAMNVNRCGHCNTTIAGRFEAAPGSWGRKRLPIQIPSRPDKPPLPNEQEPMPMPAPPSPTNQGLALEQNELIQIHQAASEYVAGIVNGIAVDLNQELGELANVGINGIYVTLKRGETLRGCCGLQGQSMKLSEGLANAALRTARHDPRMVPISAIELPYLELTISILGPPRPIGASGDDRVDVIEIGKHGLRIQQGQRAGLLLPVVPVERDWNARQFLDAVCTKANLPPGVWKSDDVDLMIFDGIDYTAPIKISGSIGRTQHHLLSCEETNKLCQWVRSNLDAFRTGATPFYYAVDVSDATVAGIVLRVTAPNRSEPFVAAQLSLRDGIPLQSTLFQMTQNLSQRLAESVGTDAVEVDLAVLSSVVHQGSLKDCDLRGIDNDHRAIVVIDHRRWAIQYESDVEVNMALRKATESQAFRMSTAQVYSAGCDSNANSISSSFAPRAVNQITSRSPAVAGSFYPAEDAQRDRMVDQWIDKTGSRSTREVNAVMVPHAGLRFSGRIAADVFQQVRIPESVLIIGPKHTAEGVDWAVAPHDKWLLSSNSRMDGDIELATNLADMVPGMELDAAAHAREHGIEVQLPLLHRIAPQTRITAIAMSGGDFDEIDSAANDLASFISSLDHLPLMIISSDMNHFADEDETHRRDRLALDALKRNDPKGLLEVCAAENISMCGQIPAALGSIDIAKDESKPRLPGSRL